MLDSILADRDLIVDMVKVSTMLIVSRLLIGGDLGNETWMKGSDHYHINMNTFQTSFFINLKSLFHNLNLNPNLHS